MPKLTLPPGTSRIVSRVAFILIFVGLLIWRFPLDEALATFKAVNYGWILLALPVFNLSKLIHTIRWRIFLGHIPNLPLVGLFGTFAIHNMINTIMPLRVGDIARIQIAARRYNIPRAELTATVIVVESLLDGVTFVVLLFLAFMFFDVPWLRANLLWGISTMVLIGVILAMAAARFKLPTDLEHTWWGRRLPDWMRSQIAILVPPFINGLSSLRDYRLAAQALAISFPAWLIEVIVFWLLGEAFGLGLPFNAYIAIMIAANFIVSLPVVPTSLGAYEYSLAEVVALFGADRATAAGYAIGTHIFISIWVIITGLVSARLLGLKWADVIYLRV